MIGTHLKELREQKKLSLRVAAQTLGVDVAYLSRVEAGKVPPSDQLLERAAESLGCSADDLLLLAGRVPPAMRGMVAKYPSRAAAALNQMARMCVAEPGAPYGEPLLAERGTRAIEDGFPFEALSEVAEVESWRKEVYRPIYHTHKWWAQRLGSVFRAAIIGATSPKGSSVMDLFYEPLRLPGVVVFDPFMGSGTTVGEAHKLGCTAIGRDINPVAFRSVHAALGNFNKDAVERAFASLDETVGKKIRTLYEAEDSEGKRCQVLYFFWVKVLPCPDCSADVDLFSNYVFATHAYKKKNPLSRILCPGCGDIIEGRYDSTEEKCACGLTFDPQHGPARRTTATCTSCSHEFSISRTARSAGKPPEHRLYAKLVLKADGSKEYLRITEKDLSRFRKATQRLAKEKPRLPDVEITHGHNTKQILNYGYSSWKQLFNDRQLLILSMLATAIAEIDDAAAREALAILFSGALEFNNMFASYKGEGTGAVRHMFSHHILKPERTPIEANVWGTPKSSGSFSTLYRSRLLRSIDYRNAPFELSVDYSGKRKSGRKVLGVSPPMGASIASKYPKSGLPAGAIYLSCGDSSDTDIPDKSVDAVVTDPPFFDNVHYSELADFFYVWQELYFGKGGRSGGTTRNEREVQDVNVDGFANKLRDVFKECHRVLKDDGLLVFSYHHSREDGWHSLAKAVLGSGFRVVQSQPVKAEMSVAAPKSQAKEPIDIDVLLVCRKAAADARQRRDVPDALASARQLSEEKIRRFNATNRHLSRNDVRVVLLSQVLVELSAGRELTDAESALNEITDNINEVIEALYAAQNPTEPRVPVGPQRGQLQLTL